METKTFSVVTSISMILTLTVAVLSIIGITITGLYPGIIVLLLVALIPITSKFYAKKIISKPNGFRRNYYTTLTIINLLSILIVLWMTFVIVHDRVLQDCCWFLCGRRIYDCKNHKDCLDWNFRTLFVILSCLYS